MRYGTVFLREFLSNDHSLQLSGLRRVVKRTEKDKENAYALLGHMKKQLTDRRQYLDDVVTRKRELIERKRDILDTKYSAEEKANKMDKLYLDEQEREMALNSELKLLSERMYKITQEVFDHKAKEKNLEADINGSIVTMNNLQTKTSKLDHEAMKQQEVLYHQVDVQEVFFFNDCFVRRILKFNRLNVESIVCRVKRVLKNKRC